jgi:hypothetical protein
VFQKEAQCIYPRLFEEFLEINLNIASSCRVHSHTHLVIQFFLFFLDPNSNLEEHCTFISKEKFILTKLLHLPLCPPHLSCPYPMDNRAIYLIGFKNTETSKQNPSTRKSYSRGLPKRVNGTGQVHLIE